LIESYEFGEIVINGKRHTNDVIIFPNKVLDNWWRKEGHRLQVEDLSEVLNAGLQTEVLVVGTGNSGLMEVSDEVKEVLKSKGIMLIFENTKKAWHTFNKLLKSGQNVVAAFHLTC